MFGQNFEGHKEEVEEVATQSKGGEKTDLGRFTAKKSKAVMKSGGKTKYQYEVMISMGIPREEIYIFADPSNWLDTFSSLWKENLTALGCSIDW